MIYFVATPIGNLKDITLRAIEVLRGADVIFCEDTRHSLKLLSSYEIKKPLYALHKFNEREAGERVLAAAAEGKEIAIISDAGMPVISDPGNVLCKMLKESGVEYSVIPGANAALCALILSGLDADRFFFAGFLPEKAGDKKRLLESCKNLDCTLLFHVAPQDLDRDIAAMYSAFGERRACAVREITKLHEEAVPFNLSEGFTGERRGEFVIAVEGAKEKENPLNSLDEREHILYYIGKGYDKKEAVKLAAKDRGVPKSEMYKFSVDI